MFFKPESIEGIVRGTKTETRRAVKEGEEECVMPLPDDRRFFQRGKMFVVYPAAETREITCVETNGRAKWLVGRDYAVSPGRGKPGVWWNPALGAWKLPTDELPTANGTVHIASVGGQAAGWQPLRIRIVSLRRERLQNISNDDLIAEGMEVQASVYDDPCDVLDAFMDARQEYERLWDRINGKGSYARTGDVWCITFAVVR